MEVQMTTEQAFQVLSKSISNVAVKADLERRILIRLGCPKAAHSIGAMMRLIWKLHLCCKSLLDENVKLREESMKFDPVAKAQLN